MESPGGGQSMAEPPGSSDEPCPYVLYCTTEPPETPQFYRFLDLPRELRDSIYDFSHENSQKFRLHAPPSPFDNGGRPSDSAASSTEHIEDISDIFEESPKKYLVLRASIECRPPLGILLCSKAIKKECEERSKQAMRLTLKDNELYGFQAVTLPKQARDLFWAEIHLILFCCDHPTITHMDDKDCHAVGEIAKHRRWIEKLVTSQMRELRSFSIHAHLCYNDLRSGYRVQSSAPCEAFMPRAILDLCTLPKLKELTLSKYDFKAQPDLEGPKTVIFEWPFKSKKEVSKIDTSVADTAQGEIPPAYDNSEKTAEFSA